MGAFREDITWAAGFLEGEGSFASNAGTPTVTASQALDVDGGEENAWPLLRLRQIFGGRIDAAKVYALGRRPIQHWIVRGRSGAAAAYMVFPFLSPRRRRQIKQIISAWQSVVPFHVRPSYPCGHPRTEANSYLMHRGDGPGSFYCKQCQHTRGAKARRRMAMIPGSIEQRRAYERARRRDPIIGPRLREYQRQWQASRAGSIRARRGQEAST